MTKSQIIAVTILFMILGLTTLVDAISGMKTEKRLREIEAFNKKMAEAHTTLMLRVIRHETEGRP